MGLCTEQYVPSVHAPQIPQNMSLAFGLYFSTWQEPNEDRAAAPRRWQSFETCTPLWHGWARPQGGYFEVVIPIYICCTVSECLFPGDLINKYRNGSRGCQLNQSNIRLCGSECERSPPIVLLPCQMQPLPNQLITSNYAQIKNTSIDAGDSRFYRSCTLMLYIPIKTNWRRKKLYPLPQYQSHRPHLFNFPYFHLKGRIGCYHTRRACPSFPLVPLIPPSAPSNTNLDQK